MTRRASPMSPLAHSAFPPPAAATAPSGKPCSLSAGRDRGRATEPPRRLLGHARQPALRARDRGDIGARPILGEEPARRHRPPSACHAAGRDRLSAAPAVRPARPLGRFLAETFGIVFAFRWTGAARLARSWGFPDGARDPPVARRGRPPARGSRGHARRREDLRLSEGHPAAGAGIVAGMVLRSPAASANSAPRSPSCPTSRARRGPSRRRSIR